MMIILKIIIAICLFSGIFFFFWYLQRTKIIEKGLATVRGSIEETAARRQIEAHANLLIRDQKNKGRLEKIIERPEKLYIYSRIGKIVRGLSFEAWAVLVVLTTAGAYLGTVIITKNTMTGLLAAIGYYLLIKIAEMILARRNFKAVDKSLLEFLNQLGNFSAIQGEITNVLHQTAQYTPPILAEALEECYIEAQTTGNVSAALMGLADQFEHEKFKEIIINLEVCSRYTANLKVIVDSLRRNLMDAKRASQERRAIADSAHYRDGYLVSNAADRTCSCEYYDKGIYLGCAVSQCCWLCCPGSNRYLLLNIRICRYERKVKNDTIRN